jgi:hypothetical protein
MTNKLIRGCTWSHFFETTWSRKPIDKLEMVLHVRHYHN